MLDDKTNFENTLYNIKCELQHLSDEPRRFADCVRAKLSVSEREYALRAKEHMEYILTRDLDKVMRAMNGKRAYGESK